MVVMCIVCVCRVTLLVSRGAQAAWAAEGGGGELKEEVRKECAEQSRAAQRGLSVESQLAPASQDSIVISPQDYHNSQYSPHLDFIQDNSFFLNHWICVYAPWHQS